MEGKLISVANAAKRLNCTKQTIYERIYKGEAVMEAIEMFADAYNIKIPGVNAPNEEELD